MRPIRRIIVHHSASPDSWTLDDVDRSHRARGFDCVGYHFVVEKTGLIRLGRPVSKVGAHCKGLNSYSIGVCLIGSFENGGTIPGDQWAAAVSLVRDFMRQYDLPIAEVYGHMEVKPTLCPGFDPAMFRDAVTCAPVA